MSLLSRLLPSRGAGPANGHAPTIVIRPDGGRLETAAASGATKTAWAHYLELRRHLETCTVILAAQADGRPNADGWVLNVDTWQWQREARP